MNEPVPQIVWAVMGLAIGALISWLIALARQREALAAAATTALQASTELQVELSAARKRASRLPELETRRAQAAEALEQAAHNAGNLRDLSSRLTAELAAERENLATLRSLSEETQSRFEAKSAEAGALAIEVAQLRNTLEGERNASQEKLALLLEAKQALTDQFKALANEILEEKTKRFTEQNQTNLGALLDPLKLRINEFQAKVEDTYVKGGAHRRSSVAPGSAVAQRAGDCQTRRGALRQIRRLRRGHEFPRQSSQAGPRQLRRG